MIINLYIECKSENDRNNLESILYAHQYAFYNATEADSYTRESSNFPTLDSIEADIELK